MAISVRTWPDGTPSMTSKRLMVAVPILDRAARSEELHLSRALAALICALVINPKCLYNDSI